MTELRFQFEVFEGPLDLLLHLVRKEEVDIYEVDMVKIADQFCEYVELMKRFDLNVAGEFIVMASTLMYIKSKDEDGNKVIERTCFQPKNLREYGWCHLERQPRTTGKRPWGICSPSCSTDTSQACILQIYNI